MAYFQCMNIGGGTGDVADVEVNGTSVIDPVTKIAEITSYKEVTESEYEAIPVAERESNGIAYFIKDLDNESVQGYPPLIYSDEEREIGVWRDGKPLYQKSFVIDTSNLNTGWNDISSGLSGIDCKDITGKFRFPANDNSIYEFPYAEDSNYCLFGGYKPTNDTIFVYKGQGFTTISDFVVTLRYTKTTDTAGSGIWNGQGGYAHHYSTSEKVIGTWIDGKPIYEKTWTGLNVTATTSWLQLTDVSISNVSNVINCKLFRESTDTAGVLVTMQLSEYGVNDPDFTCLQVKVGNESAGKKIKIAVVQYTKSTD